MVSWLRPELVSIAIPSLNPDGIYCIANSSHPAVFVDIQCVYLLFLVELKMEAGYSSSMTLSICLQPLHDRIFTSGLWVCSRAHVSRIRGNFFWPAQLFSSGLWMPAWLAAKHQWACAKKYIFFMSLQIFGIIFTISQGKIMDKWGALAGNIFLCIFLLIGTVMTGEVLASLFSLSVPLLYNNELQPSVSCWHASTWFKSKRWHTVFQISKAWFSELP